jgi:NodT family efflux transporter outer membrane factor (OMF) lipoprotein
MQAGLLKCAHKNYVKIGVIAAIFINLPACMVGPNFHRQAAPKVNSYNETPLPAKTTSTSSIKNAGKSQEFAWNKDIPADWWYLFRSPPINELIKTGLANSPNLAAAQAALRQAQEAVNVQIGNSLLPAVNAVGSGERQRFASSSFGDGIPSSLFNVYNANVNVSYTFDFFGGARRQVESLMAQVDYQQFQLIAAYLTLTSNIVTTAITVASLEDQIRTTKELITAEEDQLNIIRKQFQLGGVASTNVLSQQTLVDQTRATLPPLQKSLSQSLHSLSVLVGAYPNAPLPKINLDALELPKQVPVSLPSYLVRQRPDVRASEALLHAATAQVGVATAGLFPQFSISGAYGWSGSVPSTLFQPQNLAWNFIGQAAQPIFHGGALIAQRREAIAAYDQAMAQYRQVVLQAFQNVADSLRAIETDARTLQAQRLAEISARKNLRVTTEQYRLGGVNYLNLLTAQEQYLQARINRIQAQAARYADTAALFQSLGGGWWNRHLMLCKKDPINPTNASMCPI